MLDGVQVAGPILAAMRAFIGILVLALLLAVPASGRAQGVYPDIPAKDLPRAPVVKPGTPLKPGEMFRDCSECPDMVVVPPGVFLMGSTKYKSEQPQHLIRVKRPFAIGRFELTHDEWGACVKEGGCGGYIPDDHHWGRGRHPVMNVNHSQAEEYARWLSQRTGADYHLPSEAQWEYAAKAGTTTNYWFGDSVGRDQVNCRGCGTPWSGIGNAPVGSFEPNPWGIYDMNGNAFEWVADCWHPNYKGAPKDLRPWIDPGCPERVIRGGSWYYYSRMARSANRQKNAGDVRSYWLSFRVVRELK